MTENEPKKHTPSKIVNRQQGSFNETFESAILERPQKYAMDKTLVQGIKENDSSKIIENTQESGMVHGQQLYDEQNEIHEMFVSTRKKFDQSKQTSSKLEQQIQRSKRQKELLMTEKTKLEQNFTSEQKEFKKIQQQLDRLNALCETADYEKAIRLQMGEVIRQDILHYKRHCFEVNTRILRSHNKLKSLTGQYETTKKVTTNCRALVYSVQKKITDNQTKRYTKLHSFHEIINKKAENNYKKQQREKMIEQSMLQALYGKMPEQQQRKKLLFSNMLLKRMLKTKMQREMLRFSQTQTSFRKIQQNTTVKRVDEFVDKFIRREKIYGQLLQSISKNEDKINMLKQQHQTLEKEHHDIVFMKQMIEEKENQKRTEASKQLSVSIDVLRERLLRNQFLKNKTVGFASKFIAAYDSKSLTQVKETLHRNTPNNTLKTVLLKINQFMDNLHNENNSDQKLKEIYIESRNLTLPSTVKQRNLRIKTLAVGEENQNSAMENYDLAHDDVSEREFLNQNRKQIKKSAYLRNRMKTRAS